MSESAEHHFNILLHPENFSAILRYEPTPTPVSGSSNQHAVESALESMSVSQPWCQGAIKSGHTSCNQSGFSLLCKSAAHLAQMIVQE